MNPNSQRVNNKNQPVRGRPFVKEGKPGHCIQTLSPLQHKKDVNETILSMMSMQTQSKDIVSMASWNDLHFVTMNDSFNK